MMKKSILLIIGLCVSILILGCATSGKTDGITMDSMSNQDGKLSIVNESGTDVILFVNGDAYKRVPSNFRQEFKVLLTPEMAQNTNKVVQIDIYPENVVAQDNYEITLDTKDKFVFSQQIRSDSMSEFDITAEAIASAESDHAEGKLTNQEFIFHFPSNAKSYLIELYSNKECTERFAVGSLMPGETLSVFKNPETMVDVTVYAKYIRNDGKGKEEIARGQVGGSMVVRGEAPIDITIPVDPSKLVNPKIYGAMGRLSNIATLIIENTLPIDTSANNIIIVNMETNNQKIENHRDLQNKIKNSSYIDPKTTVEYIIDINGETTVYRLFIQRMSSGEIIKILDVELESGEEYYLSFPGELPTGIASSDIELSGSDLQRKVIVTTNIPDVTISYEVTTTDTGMLIESMGFIELGSTDNTRRPSLQTQITLPIKGLTYSNSANAKIILTAQKAGYFSQTKSINVQKYLESVQGINIETFNLEEVDF